MTVGVGAIFNSVSKIIRDCISFALLLFVIGLENSHHSISQSNAKLKPMTNLIAHVFPRFRKLAWFYFEFSLALKSSFLSSVWPLWLLWVFFLRHNQKELSRPVIKRPIIGRKTEGGRTFTVTACQAWNSLPLSMQKIAPLNSFRNSLWKKIFEEQQLLNHFILWFSYTFVLLIDFISYLLYFYSLYYLIVMP